jgi:alginate O-acetyltransferase complex protein AlgI
MLFNSFHFLIFFIVVTTAYFVLEHKYRWMLLLAASCYFYMVFVPVYIVILGFTIIVDYFAGIYIEKSQGRRRKWFLVASLIANIGVLAVFKYYNFLNENLSVLLHGAGYENPIPYLSILLPIGLSFHTFQAMSYTIEVYRGNQKSERNFGIYALYVMFYPQLVAGPIERPQNLLHQFYEKHSFDYNRVTSGLKLMAWGLFKKMVIADRLASVTDTIYNNPQSHDSIPIIIATIFFAFQIYCDFSGYSDIAIGSAQVMGFKLMRNFNRPYLSKSISEFWGRWHISLSTWFKDYLYIPLGGNRVAVPRWYLNLFIVFLVSGLWHGANWTFIIWGGLHGFYLVFALITEKFRRRVNEAVGLTKHPKVLSVLQIITTFILADFAWIFFRANNVSDAFYIVRKITVDFSWKTTNWNLGLAPVDLALVVITIIFMEWIHILQNKISIRQTISQKPLVWRWVIYCGWVAAIILLGVFEDRNFIYFQF